MSVARLRDIEVTPMNLLMAACADDDPRLFDATTPEDALEALQICAICLVKDECLEWVKPHKSYYDGVAAGRLWLNGQPVDVGLF